MERVRAKMSCNRVETTNFGGAKPQHKVYLGAVYGSEGENKDYADATPSAECWMQISDGRPAFDFFKPGKVYYVTFTEAIPPVVTQD